MQTHDEEFSFKSLFTPVSTLKAIHIIIVVGIFVFFNVLFNGMVWDDLAIFQSPDITGGFNIYNLFKGNIFNILGYYRPLGAVYFSLLYGIFGANVFFYHLIQISLHIATSILVFLLFKKFFASPKSLLLSLIFLVHPMNVESVVFISSTISVNALFFGLLAFLLATGKNISYKKYLLIGILLWCSLLTKELGITMVLLLCLYVFIFLKERFKPLLAIGAITLSIYALMHLLVTPVRYSTKFYIPITELSLQERILNIPSIIMYYVKTFIFPQQLSINQLWIIKDITLYNFYLPLLLILLFIGFLLKFILSLHKTKDEMLKTFVFFLIWFCISFFMYLQIFPLQDTVADRWFYLPIIGLLGMIGVVTQRISSKNISVKRIGMYVVIVLIVLLSIRTMIRSSNWQNELTLYSHDIQVEDNYQMEDMLGTAYYSNKINNQALYHLKRSVLLYPHQAVGWYKLGILYVDLGNRKLGEKYLRHSIDLDQNFDLPNYALAMYTYKYESAKAALPMANDLVKKFPDKLLYIEFQKQIEHSLKNNNN